MSGRMPPARHASLHRYYTDVWQRGNVAALDDLLTSDYIDHDPLPGFGADRAAAKAMAAHVTSEMTDVQLQIHHLISDGDLAAAHWTMTWRPVAGPQQPAAGAEQSQGAATRIRLRGHDFFRLRHDRICEVWHCEALAGPLGQPGQQAAR
jgi:predicted SnoaL-like aldol condensation-catalyzing enzyme